MDEFLKHIEVADVIAILVVVGVIILNWKGVPTMLNTSAAIIIGYYFGRRIKKSHE